MNLQTIIRAKRRSLSRSLCYLITLQLCLQTFTIAPVNADLDFWTKLKLIGLLALSSKKVSIFPIPIGIPIPIHIHGKEEVVYIKAPAPPVPYSSAYSYSPMMESHSHVYPQYIRPPKPSSMYSSPKMQHDFVGHASELVPVIAESTLPRYGERIVPGGQSAARPPAAVRAAQPVHRQRTQRTRVVVRPRPQSNVEYYEPVSTTPAPAPPTPAPVLSEYYNTPYEPEPVNKTEIHDQDSSYAEALPAKQSSESALPENLLNYIRQVQGLTDKGQNQNAGQSGQFSPVSETVQPTSELGESGNNGDKWRVIKSNTTESTPITVAQLPPQQSSISIQHQHSVAPTRYSQPSTAITTPIQSQWQQNYHSVGVSSPSHYQASDYVYRPPELKVMTNMPRYNPTLDQPRSTVKPIISPLRQSFGLHDSHSNQATQSFSNSAPVSLQPTQFLYTVTHDNPANTPFSYSSPSQYSNLNNFGLNAFRQSQLKPNQSSKPSTYLPSLSASASVESAKWIKPAEKGTKSKFFNNFGHRLSQIF